MKISLRLVVALITVSPGLTTLSAAESVSAARILAHTRVLASDEFEGRSPGTPGEDKTVAYLEREFRALGLQPGNPDGSFIQAVPLAGITSKAELAITTASGALPLAPTNDYVAVTTRIAPRVEAKNTEVVFVGYGVVAPEYGWDDYKGVDVRGKTVVMLINDPPVTDASGQLDPKVFGGKAMTYYGRWTYKYEIAAQKGAAACLIVHETAPAAYPFAVVVSSWGRENFEIRAKDGNAGNVGLQGWLTLDATQRLFQAAGQDFATLKRTAATREFRPVALGAKASFAVTTTIRNVDSRNVAALLPGSDPKLAAELVVYSSHWDHLGRDPRLPGDQIYNGAADNAAGAAVLLELARTFKSLPANERPRRSILFLAVTAEERGLLGSRYYAHHPLYPLRQTLANINMDGANQFGRTEDIEIVGYGASSIDDLATAVARDQGRRVKPEANPERGTYYRSDHFEFAKEGVPAFYAKPGKAFIGQPADFADKVVAEYIAKHYHQPSDDVKPDWTFEGAAQDADFLRELGRRIANGERWPTWREGNEFKAKRDAMMAPR
jgi:Zn-dependent M28 family amino/carboxypeptidase